MNAVEIEQEVSRLVDAPFDSATFPYEFLRAFGVSEAAVAKLRAGKDNKSDVPGAVLQRSRNNIHLKACPPGTVAEAFAELRASAATAKLKAKYCLATDGQTVQAVRTEDEEVLACDYADLPNRFTFFLPLAGISTVKRIDENAFDIRATGRLNKLYVELLKHNPDWDTDARRQDLNHFFARLIFCFFAEDTNIFVGGRLFTDTLEQMTVRDGSNVHEVLAECFRAMNTPPERRASANLRPWADIFPYVNGNLFGGDDASASHSYETPRFNATARTYLIFVGNLDWRRINPDIFGSMIQAVADDEERGALGMHYTSVPNILKVLNPLFLDDLRAKLDEAGDGKSPGSARKLLNLRHRLAHIRVFDPACGSGNFLVIAYKQMREIEHAINTRRSHLMGGEADRPSEIPISNFRGIELRHFPTEIARLALVIAQYQCDVLYRGEQLARDKVLPLAQKNWITHGNALRLDWLKLCPPEGTGVKLETDDGLFREKLDQAEIDFVNVGGETYICGNPPYLGSAWQTKEHRADLAVVFEGRDGTWRLLDYVAGWFVKAADYGKHTRASTAFVATNSLCQGQQVAALWPLIFQTGHRIVFAHTSFHWANLASHNAGVTVAIIGISTDTQRTPTIYSSSENAQAVARAAQNINAYLVSGPNIIVKPAMSNLNGFTEMVRGNTGNDGGNLYLTAAEFEAMPVAQAERQTFFRQVYGSEEFINGRVRYCVWIEDDCLTEAMQIEPLASRVNAVREIRLKSRDAGARRLASRSHQFREMNKASRQSIIVPRHSSENRPFLPVGLLSKDFVVADSASALYDGPLWNLALIASRLHLIWIATVSGKLETRYRYSNTMGWNTFPVPPLTDEHKAELTRRAEDILLARESYFPATIAEMYDPERMDTEFPDLRAAHERNDETLEQIYIGRRFRNDTERLEKLFALYTEMTSRGGGAAKTAKPKKRRKSRTQGE